MMADGRGMVDDKHLKALGSLNTPYCDYLLSESDLRKKEKGWMSVVKDINPLKNSEEKWPAEKVTELEQLRDMYQYPFDDMPESARIAAGKKLVDSLLQNYEAYCEFQAGLDFILLAQVPPKNMRNILAITKAHPQFQEYRNGCIAYIASDKEGLPEVKEYAGVALVRVLGKELEDRRLIELKTHGDFPDSTRKNAGEMLENVVMRRIEKLAENVVKGYSEARQDLEEISKRDGIPAYLKEMAVIMIGLYSRKEEGAMAPRGLWKRPKSEPVLQKKEQPGVVGKR
jgi:hypothetical protein